MLGECVNEWVVLDDYRTDLEPVDVATPHPFFVDRPLMRPLEARVYNRSHSRFVYNARSGFLAFLPEDVADPLGVSLSELSSTTAVGEAAIPLPLPWTRLFAARMDQMRLLCVWCDQLNPIAGFRYFRRIQTPHVGSASLGRLVLNGTTHQFDNNKRISAVVTLRDAASSGGPSVVQIVYRDLTIERVGFGVAGLQRETNASIPRNALPIPRPWIETQNRGTGATRCQALVVTFAPTGVDPCAGLVCGPHGACSNGRCVCHANESYFGEYCELPPVVPTVIAPESHDGANPFVLRVRLNQPIFRRRPRDWLLGFRDPLHASFEVLGGHVRAEGIRVVSGTDVPTLFSEPLASEFEITFVPQSTFVPDAVLLRLPRDGLFHSEPTPWIRVDYRPRPTLSCPDDACVYSAFAPVTILIRFSGPVADFLDGSVLRTDATDPLAPTRQVAVREPGLEFAVVLTPRVQSPQLGQTVLVRLPANAVNRNASAESNTVTLAYRLRSRVFPMPKSADRAMAGLVAWIGSRFFTGAWVNPASPGCGGGQAPEDRWCVRVDRRSVALFGGPPECVLSRTGRSCFSENAPDQWLELALAAPVRFQVSGFALRDSEALLNEKVRTWVLEGRLEQEAEWTVISTHVNDTTLRDRHGVGLWSTPAEPSNVGFHRFRVRQTGPNERGNHYLNLMGFELFGTLFADDDPCARVNCGTHGVCERQWDIDVVGEMADVQRAPVVEPLNRSAEFGWPEDLFPDVPPGAGSCTCTDGWSGPFCEDSWVARRQSWPSPPDALPRGVTAMDLVASGNVSRVPSASKPVDFWSGIVGQLRNGSLPFFPAQSRAVAPVQAFWSPSPNWTAEVLDRGERLNVSCLLESDVSLCRSANVRDLAWGLEFPDLAILPSAYRLRDGSYGAGSGPYLRNWRFEASLDGVAWTTLRSHYWEETLQVVGAVATWAVEATRAYRFFRVVSDGPNAGQREFSLWLSGLELYGAVFDVRDPCVARDCGPHGACAGLDTSADPIRCECEDGWFGLLCEQEVVTMTTAGPFSPRSRFGNAVLATVVVLGLLGLLGAAVRVVHQRVEAQVALEGADQDDAGERGAAKDDGEPDGSGDGAQGGEEEDPQDDDEEDPDFDPFEAEENLLEAELEGEPAQAIADRFARVHQFRNRRTPTERAVSAALRDAEVAQRGWWTVCWADCQTQWQRNRRYLRRIFRFLRLAYFSDEGVDDEGQIRVHFPPPPAVANVPVVELLRDRGPVSIHPVPHEFSAPALVPPAFSAPHTGPPRTRALGERHSDDDREARAAGDGPAEAASAGSGGGEARAEVLEAFRPPAPEAVSGVNTESSAGSGPETVVGEGLDAVTVGVDDAARPRSRPSSSGSGSGGSRSRVAWVEDATDRTGAGVGVDAGAEENDAVAVAVAAGRPAAASPPASARSTSPSSARRAPSPPPRRRRKKGGLRRGMSFHLDGVEEVEELGDSDSDPDSDSGPGALPEDTVTELPASPGAKSARTLTKAGSKAPASFARAKSMRAGGGASVAPDDPRLAVRKTAAASFRAWSKQSRLEVVQNKPAPSRFADAFDEDDGTAARDDGTSLAFEANVRRTIRAVVHSDAKSKQPDKERGGEEGEEEDEEEGEEDTGLGWGAGALLRRV